MRVVRGCHAAGLEEHCHEGDAKDGDCCAEFLVGKESAEGADDEEAGGDDYN